MILAKSCTDKLAEGSWCQKERRCSHSYSTRKTRGHPVQCQAEATETSAARKKVRSWKMGGDFIPPPWFFCRYGQVGENASAFAAPEPHRQGETGWREGIRETEGMGGPWLRRGRGGGREGERRRGCYMFCSALSLQFHSVVVKKSDNAKQEMQKVKTLSQWMHNLY